jgi:DNA segregation ATPase FtsK/SpoIIIE, S-DNA-T family
MDRFLVRKEGKATVSLLQRRLRISYLRAAHFIDLMEEQGIIESFAGNGKPRNVLPFKPSSE